MGPQEVRSRRKLEIPHANGAKSTNKFSFIHQQQGRMSNGKGKSHRDKNTNTYSLMKVSKDSNKI
jgi:hypothetical protein